MRGAVKLSDIHDIVLVLQDRGLVVVDVEVVRCGEDSHHTGKSRSPSLSVHSISSILGFVSSNDRKQVILLEEVACSRIGEEVGATSNMVVDEVLGSLFL